MATGGAILTACIYLHVRRLLENTACVAEVNIFHQHLQWMPELFPGYPCGQHPAQSVWYLLTRQKAVVKVRKHTNICDIMHEFSACILSAKLFLHSVT